MFNINILAGKPHSVLQVNVCFLTCTFLLGTRKRWYGNSYYAMTRTLSIPLGDDDACLFTWLAFLGWQ
jgi:hypothetical protein